MVYVMLVTSHLIVILYRVQLETAVCQNSVINNQSLNSLHWQTQVSPFLFARHLLFFIKRKREQSHEAQEICLHTVQADHTYFVHIAQLRKSYHKSSNNCSIVVLLIKELLIQRSMSVAHVSILAFTVQSFSFLKKKTCCMRPFNYAIDCNNVNGSVHTQWVKR